MIRTPSGPTLPDLRGSTVSDGSWPHDEICKVVHMCQMDQIFVKSIGGGTTGTTAAMGIHLLNILGKG